MTTSLIFPNASTTGDNSAFLPVSTVIVGLLTKLTILVTPYPTPPDCMKTLDILPFTTGSAVAV